MASIPKNEIIWTKITSKTNGVYYITSKPTRDCYFIYKLEDGNAIKLGKGTNPSDLETKYVK